jgi:hypothetical protein
VAQRDDRDLGGRRRGGRGIGGAGARLAVAGRDGKQRQDGGSAPAAGAVADGAAMERGVGRHL